jgi:hypothetical protein
MVPACLHQSLTNSVDSPFFQPFIPVDPVYGLDTITILKHSVLDTELDTICIIQVQMKEGGVAVHFTIRGAW